MSIEAGVAIKLYLEFLWQEQVHLEQDCQVWRMDYYHHPLAAVL